MRPMKFEPDDLVDVPACHEAGGLVSDLEQIEKDAAQHLDRLSAMVLTAEPPGGDRTLLYHLWMLSRASELAESVKKTLKKSEEMWERYVAQVLEARDADGTAALGRKITVEPDFDPGAPSEKSAEYVELIAWLKESQFADIVQERFHWQSLKKVCGELSEQGLPPPPNVKLYPKHKVRLT